MLDTLSQVPVMDMMMGASSGSAASIFQELKRKAEEARAQAQAQNPTAQLPPIDYAGLMEKATQIAAGTPPEQTLEPERIAEAKNHLGGALPPGPSGMSAPAGDSPGLWGGMGRNYQGEEIPADAARRARFSGMTDAGLALLGSASEGNIGRGLAEGISAFQGGMGRELEGFTARRREAGLDDLRRRSTEESMEASREARERAAAGEGREETAFKQSQEDRESALAAMRDQLSEIEGIAGADSPEAERGRALLRGGPTLFSDLDKLHQQVIARKRFPEDQAMETDAELARRKRLFEEDPGERYERVVEGRRIAIAEENAKRYGAGARGELTESGYLTALDRETDRIYRALLEAKKVGGFLPPSVDPMEVMDEAESLAERRLEEKRTRRGGGGGGGGGGGEDTDAKVQEVVQQIGGDPSAAERALVRQLLARGMSVSEVVSEIRRRMGE